jgi:tRNA/tmRNA/rRNA uracil-C5-methylase (TrmA/RlmC/RlmD family)
MDGFEVIAQYVAKLVPPKSTVCELYAGVGILGLTALAYHHLAENDNPAATALRWLRCSDENPANLKCFERSIRSMPASITGASIVYSKQQSTRNKANKYTTKATYMVASATTAVQEGQALGASVLLVDPPRSGLDEFVLTELCKPRNPKQPHVEDLLLLDAEGSPNINLLNDVTTLIYVSCGFESFSRDCERILSANAGWSIHSSIGYLLFPGSNHIETVTLFRRQLSSKRMPVAKKVTSFGSSGRQKR